MQNRYLTTLALLAAPVLTQPAMAMLDMHVCDSQGKSVTVEMAASRDPNVLTRLSRFDTCAGTAGTVIDFRRCDTLLASGMVCSVSPMLNACNSAAPTRYSAVISLEFTVTNPNDPAGIPDRVGCALGITSTASRGWENITAQGWEQIPNFDDFRCGSRKLKLEQVRDCAVKITDISPILTATPPPQQPAPTPPAQPAAPTQPAQPVSPPPPPPSQPATRSPGIAPPPKPVPSRPTTTQRRIQEKQTIIYSTGEVCYSTEANPRRVGTFYCATPSNCGDVQALFQRSQSIWSTLFNVDPPSPPSKIVLYTPNRSNKLVEIKSVHCRN